ncbi:MAG: phosphomannomutase [Haloarculaceae archaeon]
MELFGTAGIRGDVRKLVTPELAVAVGRAAGTEGDEFVVARDGRTTGDGLASAVAAGLTSAGADVVRVGQVPTPTLAYASRGRRGVMVTASHNPPGDNGIKLFADGRAYDREAEARVEERVAAEPDPAPFDEWGETSRAEVLSGYRDAVVDFARGHGAPLEGMPVAVDAGNGVTGLVAPQALREVGADVTTLNANVDGHFPARESKPSAESLGELRRFVADGDDVVGFGHDGDGDRLVVVDADGEVVHEDTVTAIIAEHCVERSDAPDPVVLTTPNTSARIDERVAAAGGRVERVPLGTLHEGVTEIRRESDDGTEVALATEPWKHLYPEFGVWLDAVTTTAVFARLVAESGLDDLRDPVTERPYEKVNVDCADEAKEGAIERLRDELPDHFPDATADLDYGVRLEFPDRSWVLVRPSGTEPYMRVYAESDDVEELLDSVEEVVEDAAADAGGR